VSKQALDDAQNQRLIRWLTCLMFFTFAMTTDAVGSVIPEVIEQFRLSMTAASAFQYATMAGIAAGALLLGYLADKLGPQFTIIIGLALYGASSLIFAASDEFMAFVALLAIAGLGISVFKIGALALIGDVSASTASHTRVMNTVEGFFALGAIAGPAIVATLIANGMSWKWLYVIAAAICVALIVIAGRVRYPASKRQTERASAREMLIVLPDKAALGFSFLIVMYVATEVAIYVWMPTLLLEYAGPMEWLPIYALTIFFVLRALGRFLGAWFLGRLPWGSALALFGLAIFGCFAGSLALGVDSAAWLLPLSGLFMSIIYPTLNSKGISCFPKSQHGAAAGVILFFTAVAAAVGPLSMAAVSDAYGSTRAGFVLATAFAFLLFAGLAFNWLADPAKRRLTNADRDDYGTRAPLEQSE
jgi:DHA1 family quinolone resistance protein-like MFS transporter